MLSYAKQLAPDDIANHYTPRELAKHLVSLVPARAGELLFDPCAGDDAFFAAFPKPRAKCEIAAGTDFLTRPFKYDWAITNPPYHLLWRFIDKTSMEARCGFAFLVNINGVNTLTPKRLSLLATRGFYIRRLYVCNIRRWFGRYYFYVFSRNRGSCALDWEDRSW